MLAQQGMDLSHGAIDAPLAAQRAPLDDEVGASGLQAGFATCVCCVAFVFHHFQ